MALWPFSKKQVQAQQTTSQQQIQQPQQPAIGMTGIAGMAGRKTEEVLFQAGQQPQAVEKKKARTARVAETRRALRKHSAGRKSKKAKRAEPRKKSRAKRLKRTVEISASHVVTTEQKNLRSAKIIFLKKQIKKLRNEVDIDETQISKLGRLINMADDYVVVKHLEDLNWEKFKRANRNLNIQKNDVLSVEKTDTVSRKTIDFLRGKLRYVFYRKPLNKTLEQERFIFLDASQFHFKKYPRFYVVSADEFEKKTKTRKVLQKMLSLKNRN